MKNLIYLFAAVTMFAFTACGGGDTATEETTGEVVVTTPAVEDTTAVEDVVECADDCQKACCLGCKATEGDAKCIVLEDGSMPCCVAKETPHDESVPHTH